MIFIILGKPIVFWLGLLALIFFLIQISTGILMTKGHPKMFKYHKISAIIFSIIVLLHVLFALSLYI